MILNDNIQNKYNTDNSGRKKRRYFRYRHSTFFADQSALSIRWWQLAIRNLITNTTHKFYTPTKTKKQKFECPYERSTTPHQVLFTCLHFYAINNQSLCENAFGKSTHILTNCSYGKIQQQFTVKCSSNFHTSVFNTRIPEQNNPGKIANHEPSPKRL